MRSIVDIFSLRPLFLTLIIGITGSIAASYANIPAAALVGAILAVSTASMFRLTVEIPTRLRNIAFTIIGCSLGSGITREALSQTAQWPFSLLALGIAVALTMLTCCWVLCRFFSQSGETALLATSPGAFAYSLGLAASGIGDIRSIVVIQNIRLLMVTTLLPFILDTFGFEPGHTTTPAVTGGTGSVAVIFVALAVGISVSRWKIPASFLIAGMLVSGIGHYMGVVIGRPPETIIFAGFAVTGSMVGARFSSIPRSDLKRLLLASLSIGLISGLLSVIFAIPVARILNIPFGQVFVAYAPGGVEAMAAMAIALGYDPAYVATHHLFRIFLLFFFLPVGINLFRKIRK